ncbi:MAG: hypothetical protein ACODAQ_10360 [Phycisphaeraceae bacterium]
MFKKFPAYATALMLGWSAAPALAQDAPLADQVLYGINGGEARLVRYDFNAGELTDIGAIQTLEGATLAGIEGSAYVPGFQNIFAFWVDPDTDECRLVYVDVTTASAAIVGDTVEGGRITGATAYPDPEADNQWNVFVVQEAQTLPPFSIEGLVNINPNNSDHMEFSLTRSDGSTITRDDLHEDANIDEDGDYYQGEAVRIHIRPKGNGNQNGLIIDGEPYPLQNANTYTFVGEMNVRVFNDKPKDGKAMGHWWLEIIDGTAQWEGDLEVATPQRLAQVDHQTGELTELFPTEHAYDSLGTFDGQVFYATRDDQLYLLDPATESETLVGTIGTGEHTAIEMVNDAAMAFEHVSDTLRQLDHTTGEAQSADSLGAQDLGTIVFVDDAQDLYDEPVSVD